MAKAYFHAKLELSPSVFEDKYLKSSMDRNENVVNWFNPPCPGLFYSRSLGIVSKFSLYLYVFDYRVVGRKGYGTHLARGIVLADTAVLTYGRMSG